MRALYTALLFLATPLLVARLLWRSLKLPAYRQRIGERFGFVAPAPQGIAVWLHAVSVGETLAAAPLIEALIARHGEGRVWVTTTTPTGSERVLAAFGSRVRHSYIPYDLPGAVARFLKRVQPQRVVVMETELWPNLFAALRQRALPLLLVNARLSPRSFRGYGRVRGFAARTLACVTEVCAQSEADAQRFRDLGAPRVSAPGNLKFDLNIPDAARAQGHALRRLLGEQRPVWIAASTHEGEEAQILQAHLQLLQPIEDILLILVPRHPQRFDAVARSIEAGGFGLLRRSQINLADGTLPQQAFAPQVLLGDSMGEMLMYYAASDVAFVGGSWAPIGGHNVLEPAALGLPVCFGPQMHNFLAARELLLEHQAAFETRDPAALAGQMLALLRDPQRRAAMGAAGQAAVSANRGALQRILARIDACA
jgi:3-deoxy-D-manno-octulosonic-acid transferase